VRVANIFVSYTSKDRDWANWIGRELEALGHVPHIDHWEVSAGGNIMEWMEKRHHEANHVLCIVSETYLKKPYSSLERQAGQWAAVTARPNFVLPVFIEPCEAPTLLAPFKRCDLHGLEEEEARASLYANIPNDGVVLGSLMRSGFTALTVSPATARSMICTRSCSVP
jgi:TIR domain